MKHKKEKIIILLLIIFAVGGILIFRFSGFFDTRSPFLVVTSEDKILFKLPLNENTEKIVRTEKGENTIVIRDGQAYVSEANCPNQICVHSPKISQVGETIACLPHRLLLEVKQMKNE